jgi:peptidoglycan hydrolase CwlO-like protein
MKRNLLITIMAQRSDIDLKDLTDLIKGLDKKIDELGTKVESIETKVTALDKQVGIGFSDINGKFDVVNTRLTAVETSIKTFDARLWGFIGLTVSVTLASLLTIFARYIFTNDPKF